MQLLTDFQSIAVKVKFREKKNLICRKRQRAPKYTPKQLEQILKCCHALRNKYFRESIILDDSSSIYLIFLHHELISGNDGFILITLKQHQTSARYASK